MNKYTKKTVEVLMDALDELKDHYDVDREADASWLIESYIPAIISLSNALANLNIEPEAQEAATPKLEDIPMEALLDELRKRTDKEKMPVSVAFSTASLVDELREREHVAAVDIPHDEQLLISRNGKICMIQQGPCTVLVV